MNEDLKCPKCRQIDMVQKLSVLYEGGIAKIQYQAWVPPPPGSKLPPILTKREGTNQTALSARFAPPPQPSVKTVKAPPLNSRYKFLALGLFLISLVLSFTSNYILVSYIILASAVIPLVIGLMKREEERNRIWRENVVPRWERAMSKWNSLFYCARDDGVFIPKDGNWVSAENIETFLWE
jgi:hypothetical protein